MTTFAKEASLGISSGVDPAILTVNVNDGDLMILQMSNRSGDSEADHVVTDDAVHTWTKAIGFDNLLGDADARFSFSVWYAIATADKDPFDITCDDGTTNGKAAQYTSWTPSAAYDWTFEVGAIDGSGTLDWDNVSSGNTSDPGGSDLFVMGLAGARVSADVPSGATTFDEMSADKTQTSPGSNAHKHICAIFAAGQASGAKTATIDTAGSGSGDEGIVSVIVFSDGGVGGAIPHNPLGCPILGPVGGPTA